MKRYIRPFGKRIKLSIFFIVKVFLNRVLYLCLFMFGIYVNIKFNFEYKSFAVNTIRKNHIGRCFQVWLFKGKKSEYFFEIILTERTWS